MLIEHQLLWPLVLVSSLILSHLLGLAFPQRYRQLALHPRKPWCWQMLSFHWVHGNWRHLLFNALPLLLLTTLILIQEPQRIYIATVCIVLSAGSGTWLFSSATRVAGASALVYGYWGFIVATAAISQDQAWTAMAGLTLLFYSGLWATLGQVLKGVSWSAHFWGLTGGALAACLQNYSSIFAGA